MLQTTKLCSENQWMPDGSDVGWVRGSAGQAMGGLGGRTEMLLHDNNAIADKRFVSTYTVHGFLSISTFITTTRGSNISVQHCTMRTSIYTGQVLFPSFSMWTDLQNAITWGRLNVPSIRVTITRCGLSESHFVTVVLL